MLNGYFKTSQLVSILSMHYFVFQKSWTELKDEVTVSFRGCEEDKTHTQTFCTNKECSTQADGSVLCKYCCDSEKCNKAGRMSPSVVLVWAVISMVLVLFGKDF